MIDKKESGRNDKLVKQRSSLVGHYGKGLPLETNIVTE